ncbi:hypothetical protein Tco_0806064 [Tanacetum coccineum]
MAEPNDYITATRKNFISTDDDGKIVEKCIVEIQGTFLVKIRDDAFHGNDGENVFKHIDKFLKIVGPIKINGLTQDRFRLSVFPISLKGTASEWFTKECLGSITTWDNMVKKFILKYHHLSDHDKEEETKMDEDQNENILKIFKIEGNFFDLETPLFCSGGELSGIVRVGNMTYFQDHRWYDEFADGKLKDETLALKAKIEGSWGEATSRVMKFCEWLRNSFENFCEIDYNVLGNANLEPSSCKIRRFEMMKYSFNDDEDYITIKESEHLNHSKDSLDAYQELLHLIDEGLVATTPDK